MQDCKDLVRALRAEYKQADELSQEIAAFRLQAGVPSINELRYAGHHFILAHDEDGAPCDEEQIRKAINHCKRAGYEASESGLTYTLTYLTKFKIDYAEVQITPTLSDWPTILGEMQKATEDLGKSRSEADSERTKYYQCHMEHFRRLKPRCDQCALARDELNKVVDDRRVAAIWRRIGLVGVVASIIIAVLLKFF